MLLILSKETEPVKPPLIIVIIPYCKYSSDNGYNLQNNTNAENKKHLKEIFFQLSNDRK